MYIRNSTLIIASMAAIAAVAWGTIATEGKLIVWLLAGLAALATYVVAYGILQAWRR